MRSAWRIAIGLLLLLHALAHSLPGMRATDGLAGWANGRPASAAVTLLSSALLTVALTGLMAGGLGALGARPFRRTWRALSAAGAVASLVLLIGFRVEYAAPGALLSLVILGLLWGYGPIPVQPSARSVSLPAVRRALRGLGSALAVLMVTYSAVVLVTRPWHMRWGSRDEELALSLPGDELAESPVKYGLQHAVTISAPADAVWPWLVQLGQPRGGFYSYAWLERLFGVRIKNADRIVPEWQQLAAGDSVFATQAGYLGFDAQLGWRVARVDPGRAIVLEKWGAFVLLPLDAQRTRLIVRTRGGGEAGFSGLLFAPLGLFVFEPAHFIMERGMLRGIKERVEAFSQSAPLASSGF